jgi:hypothetical protein
LVVASARWSHRARARRDRGVGADIGGQHGVTALLFAAPGYGYRMGVKPNLIEVLEAHPTDDETG